MNTVKVRADEVRPGDTRVFKHRDDQEITHVFHGKSRIFFEYSDGYYGVSTKDEQTKIIKSPNRLPIPGDDIMVRNDDGEVWWLRTFLCFRDLTQHQVVTRANLWKYWKWPEDEVTVTISRKNLDALKEAGVEIKECKG